MSWVADLAVHKPRIKIIGVYETNNAQSTLKTVTCTGICFGHQIVARALGGECVSNGGKWEVAITEVILTGLGRRIFGAPTLVCHAFLRVCIFNHVFG